MDIQLGELIEKIKNEGIGSARAEAAILTSDAESGAKKIVENAKREAEAIVARAKADAERSEKAGIAALEQAARNLALAFKGEIQELLDRLAAEAVTASYSADVIKEVLPEVIKGWAAKDANSLSVLLSEGDFKKLDDAFKAELASTLGGGVEIMAVKNLDRGFHEECRPRLRPKDLALLPCCTYDPQTIVEAMEPTGSDFMDVFLLRERVLILNLASFRAARLKRSSRFDPPQEVPRTVAVARTASEMDDPLAATPYLNRARWGALETIMGVENMFGVDNIFLYLLRLLLLEQKANLDPEKGSASHRRCHDAVLEGCASKAGLRIGYAGH
ncbi:MAG: DUF2764 family protein [Planctomycetota bacterium]|jgi:V/A-type H+-transporting ATPase subunit E|nr:DUF2764 family protein [Planctomycetota bacterium]